MGARRPGRNDAKGVGFTEAPRGALGHWIKIKDGKIDNYQCVVPTTWNGSPRDPNGNIGAFEASLLDTPMADPNQPLEIIRTLHSFDPCLACSTHVMSPDGQEMAKVAGPLREGADVQTPSYPGQDGRRRRRRRRFARNAVYVYEAPVRSGTGSTRSWSSC